jgi:hypothetical protein
MGMGGSVGGGSGQGDPLVGGAMSDPISKLLEKVAEELTNEMCHPDLQQRYQDGLALLEERLGPLLRAGQYCRDGLEPGCEPDDTYAARYDNALATLEGRE